MTWSRRGVIGGLSMSGCAALSGHARAAGAAPVVDTAQGRLAGVREGGVSIFRGVPYAGSPAGPQHRFKAPPPPPSWAGVRDATRLGAPAIQPPGLGGPTEPAPSEDCLFLNVWTPASDTAKRPVMVYFHGGGFTIGSGGRPWQDGANLARDHDVVVVASNHRLGIFGYLYLGEILGPDYTTNAGLLDLVATLAWVKANIAAFGGDPDNVMIFGESGGGGKVGCLYDMPLAAPLFDKASIESPIGPEPWSAAQATAVAREAMRALDLSDPRQLLTAPAEQLLQFQVGPSGLGAPGARPPGQKSDHRDQKFWPIIDGRILPEVPFKTHAPAISADKPLMIGGCKDEAVFFNFGDKEAFSLDQAGLELRLRTLLGDRAPAWIETFRRTRPHATPSQLLMAIETATPWRAHAVHIAEEKARQGRAPVYAYILSYESPVPVPGTDYPMGSPHASDIAIKFDNMPPPGSHPRDPFSADGSAGRRRTAANMSAMWTAFARTGRPSAPGQPDWVPFTLERRETMLIDAQCKLVSDPEGLERRFWEGEPDPEAITY